MKKILIIEDEPEVVDVIGIALDGYNVVSADSGEMGLQLIVSERPDLVLLDLNLPTMNGIEVLRRARKIDENLPVFIVSARTQELDRVLGLELGADDYITKPFSIRELKARVDSYFRRWDMNTAEMDESTDESSDDVIVRGVLRLNLASMRVTVNNDPIRVSEKEFDILRLLAGSPGEVFSRDEIIRSVWGDGQRMSARNVDTHIKRLRAKLKKQSDIFEWLETVRAAGYRFTKYYDRFTDITGK